MIHRIRGFTVIETLLVLSLTGLLAVGILAGIGRSLAQRQYIDSVNRTIDFFRGQYTAASSIENSRTPQQVCGSSGVTENTTSPVSTLPPAGTSDCFLLGNIVTSYDGIKMSVRPVVATVDTSTIDMTGKSNKDILDASVLKAGPETSDYSVDWGGNLQNSVGDPLKFTLMVVRMPTNGTIVTYVSSNVFPAGNNDIKTSGLVSDANTKDFKMCVDPSGSAGIGMSPVGVQINKAASSTTGVRSLAAGECTK